MGITPFSMNVDLGPRGKLAAKANSGATTISVKKFNKSVPFNVGDLLIIGGPTDSFRETVKIGTAVTISSSTVSVSLSSALKNSHQAGALVVSQKLPPDYDGEFIEVEELRILGDDKYAYVIPSVPKQPRYISRTGSFGDDTAKDQETGTDVDVTDNFRRYETIPTDILRSIIGQTGSNFRATVGEQFYQLYVSGYNSDGTVRPYFEPQDGEDVLRNSDADTKDPMLLTGTLIEKGSTEALAVWAATEGGTYQPTHHYLRLNVPTNFPSIGVGAVAQAVEFNTFLREQFILFDGRTVGVGLIPAQPDGYALVLDINQNPLSDVFPSVSAYNTWNSITAPAYKNPLNAGFGGYVHESLFVYEANTGVGSTPTLYLANNTTASDAVASIQMTQTIPISGTVSVSEGSTTVTGSGTAFTSELSSVSGSRKSVLRFAGNSTNYTIASIAGNTSLTLSGMGALVTQSGSKAYITSFEDIPITKLDFFILDANALLNQRTEVRGTSTTNSDRTGEISQRVFLQLPQGQTRWAAKKALDSGKNENTGFVDAFQSPEDSPNETFGFYVGKNEESLPYMKTSNKTGETLLDGRVKISGYIIDAPRVEAQELKKIRQRAGYYKAKLLPHTGYFPNLSDRPDGPPDGWEPKSRREERNLLEALKALSAEVKKEMRGG